MHIVFAPDSYGGFLSSVDACERVEATLAAHGLFVTPHPMSDGGEGLLETLIAHSTVELHGLEVSGPMTAPVFGSIGRKDGCWWIEAAEAIGLQHVQGQRKPLEATSAGLGELLRNANVKGPGPLIVGLGGTATVDGGLGMLQELGLTALDAKGQIIRPHGCGADLTNVTRLEGEPTISDRLVRVLCDVRTPIHESVTIFGPQKGLKANEIESPSGAMSQWAGVLSEWRKAHDLEPLPTSIPGGGSAGGIGYALASIFNAHLVDGARFVAKNSRLNDTIANAQIVIIGEGRLDSTSYQGKVAEVVTALARKHGAQVIAFVGQTSDIPPAPLGPDLLIEINGKSDASFQKATEQLAALLA
jgi:glycerate kinase